MKKQTIFDLDSMPKIVLIITLIVMLGLLFGAISYLLKSPKVDMPIVNPVKVLISKKNAIRTANRTEEATKFLELYPKTEISEVFKPCLDKPCAHGGGKCEWIDAWHIFYKARFEKDNPELRIVVDINNKIREKWLGCRQFRDRGSIIYPGTTSATYLDLLNDENYDIRNLCNLKTP